MQRLLFYLILIGIVYFLYKKYAKPYLSSSDSRDAGGGKPPAETEMIQDPQCGAYFLGERGVKGVVDGRVMRFCSEECYEKYLKRRSRD